MSSIFNKPKTYLDLYNETVAPRLIELDIFLKEAETPITVWQAAQLLDMPYNEVIQLMERCGISSIDYKNIFRLILNGGSTICRLIQKEMRLGFPTCYTASQLSYIYEIDKEKIDGVFKMLGVDEIDSGRICQVFGTLPLEP